MKKLIKVLSLVLVLAMVLVPVASFASFDITEGDLGGLNEKAETIGSGVYGLLRTIAIIVAVCMVAYMAIQWFLATPSKKAELKGRMWSMLIGVILLIGGVAILNVLEGIVNETTSGL